MTSNCSLSLVYGIMKKQQLGLNMYQNYQTIKQSVGKPDQFSLYISHLLYMLYIVHIIRGAHSHAVANYVSVN